MSRHAPEPAVPVLYLDLDGTVRHNRHDPEGFINAADDVAVYPEAVTMMRRWRSAGGRIIGVSNQGGVALGHLGADECARAMMRTHELTGGLFDKVAWCVHHPAAADPEMARCWCRKPAPGLLIEAALDVAARTGECYPPYMALMVGDRDEDRECARIAGVDFQDAAEWRARAVTS